MMNFAIRSGASTDNTRIAPSQNYTFVSPSTLQNVFPAKVQDSNSESAQREAILRSLDSIDTPIDSTSANDKTPT